VRVSENWASQPPALPGVELQFDAAT